MSTNQLQTSSGYQCCVCGEYYQNIVMINNRYYCYTHKPAYGDRQITEAWMKEKIDRLEKELSELRAAASTRSLAGVPDAGGALSPSLTVWAVNQMRRAARTIELLSAGGKLDNNFYSPGLDECADALEAAQRAAPFPQARGEGEETK